MNQFASDKKYLELAGLKALILKIGAMRAEYMGQNEEVNRVLANIIARLDAIVAPEGEDANVLPVTDSYDYTEGTLFECVAKYIQDLRNELGATADATDKTAYARLDQIEDWVSNGFDAEDTDEDGNVVTIHYDGLLDRVKKLEAESFAQVECTDAETVKANHKWEALFKNAKGEELAKIALDTKDFVIDGMLGDVKLIAISNEGKSIIDLSTDTEYVAGDDLEEPWKTLVAESATKEFGARYLVFSFKTKDADGHEDPENNNYADGQELKNIWVSMHDLHDNFDFKAEGAKYIELVAADPVHKVDGSTEITYKVNLTDDVVAVLEKALGEVEGVRSYDDIDADLRTAEENIAQAQDDIKQLQDYVVNGFTEEPGENGNTSATPENKKGLLERTNDLEDTVDAMIDWINDDAIIPEQFVKDYFDYIVFGGGTAAEPRMTEYEALKPIIDVEPKGHIPQFDDNGKYEGAFNG